MKRWGQEITTAADSLALPALRKGGRDEENLCVLLTATVMPKGGNLNGNQETREVLSDRLFGPEW